MSFILFNEYIKSYNQSIILLFNKAIKQHAFCIPVFEKKLVYFNKKIKI